MPTDTATKDFESSEAWEEVKQALENFADAYEVDAEVLLVGCSEVVDATLNADDY